MDFRTISGLLNKICSFNDFIFYKKKCMAKFQKVKKNNNIFENTNCRDKNSTLEYKSLCPIPEIAKIQTDSNPQNIYVLVFLSEHAIYQKYKTTHHFQILKPSIQDSFHFHSYYFHQQLPKTIEPFFPFEHNLGCEIAQNPREYVIIGWIVKCGEIIGILYVQMYNQICQNYNIMVIEDCPFVCFIGSLTNTFFGLFLNNIRIVENESS